MDFRELLNKIDTLTEGLTLNGVIAATSGYEQDENIRYPILAKLARSNGFEGLVDPVSGNYVDVDGDEDEEVPFEVAEKLSAAGLLPSNAKLPQAGWFDNDSVYKAAGAHLTNQSQQAAAKQARRSKLLAEYARLKAEIYRIARENGIDPNTILPPKPTTQAPPGPSLGSDSMNNLAKNKITPNAPTLSEAIILSMNEDFDWKGAADSASDYAQTFGRNFWNGATYGAGPETYGAAKSYANDTKAKDEIQNQRNLLAKNQKEHPYLSTAANIAGSIASPISKLGLAKSLGAAAGIGAGAYGVDKALGVHEETSEEMTADFQNWLNGQGANLDLSGQPDQATLDAIDQIILGAKK